MSNVRDFIFQKFFEEVTQKELRSYQTNTIDWTKRTKKTIEEFLPRVSDLAIYICEQVPATLNSAFEIEDLFYKQKDHLINSGIQHNWINEFEVNLRRNKSLVGSLESQQVSAEIQRQVYGWQGFNSQIINNGNSIYPDFIFANRDYSSLPFQDRNKKTVHGPCLQGKVNPKPSNVPDGIELKTNRGKRIRVDAHAPHIGLHLAFTWDFDDSKRVSINGAWLAFITESDHREATRNSKTTTVKYSFGHDKFISVL